MEQNIEKLEDAMRKVDRLTTVLGTKVESFSASERALSNCRKELTLEVEELKTLKNALEQALPELVNKAMKSNVQIMVPQLIPPLVEDFREKTFSFAESSLKETARIKGEIDRSVSEVTGLISRQKKEMNVRVAALTLVFCLSSLLTAGGIFYFFPQEVHYGLSDNTLKTYFVGEAVMEIFNKLSSHDQALIKEKMNRKIE